MVGTHHVILINDCGRNLLLNDSIKSESVAGAGQGTNREGYDAVQHPILASRTPTILIHPCSAATAQSQFSL